MIEEGELCAFRYLLVDQIAGRIRGPKVTGDSLGPHPEIPSTDIKPLACRATALYEPFLLLQLGHQGIGKIRPDLTEGLFKNITKTIMPPELICMHLAVPADTPDAPSRTVPLVHFKELEDLAGPGILLL